MKKATRKQAAAIGAAPLRMAVGEKTTGDGYCVYAEDYLVGVRWLAGVIRAVDSGILGCPNYRTYSYTTGEVATAATRDGGLANLLRAEKAKVEQEAVLLQKIEEARRAAKRD